MTSTNLIAKAILQANWDADKDYLSNFEPFVVSELQQWPPGDPVDAQSVASQVKVQAGLDLPINVVKNLLKRMQRDQLLARGDKQALYVVPEALDGRGDYSIARERARNEMSDLIRRLQEYAATHHDLQVDEAYGDAALEVFLDEFGVDFLSATRRGQRATPRATTTKQLAIVQSFARHAFEHDERALTLLEQAVQGSMLSTVLHYKKTDEGQRRLNSLVAYLDTSIVVRLLGVSLPQLADAAAEMKELLKDAGVSCRVFRHTVDEVRGVLSGTAGNLRASRSKALVSTARLSRTSREVLDHFVTTGRSAGDVEAILSELDHQLLKLGINIEDAPDHIEQWTIAEEDFGAALQTQVNYRNPLAKRRDIDSVTAIHRLRKGRSVHDLGNCVAIFVTSNTAYARTTREFMRSEDQGSPVPLVIGDLDLTTQVWVRAPGARPSLPRKLLIADSFAALNPSNQLWDKYLSTIDRLEKQGEVTSDQVTALIFSTVARAEFLDLTLGDPDAVKEETVTEVLARVVQHLATPVVEEVEGRAAAERSSNEARITQLEGALEGERSAREAAEAAQVRENAKHAEEDAAHARKVRLAIFGTPAAISVVAATVVMLVLDGSLALRVIGAMLLITLASVLLAFGNRKVKTAWASFAAIFVVVGAVATVTDLSKDDGSAVNQGPTGATGSP